ncbi:hypothetical protein B8W72_09780 [Pseudomonas putida]|uniref:Uncharacterized protein n=1 Tax=Pseudomonas putida TaxID=303 RepID=A0A1Y3LI37_PSEPU|nr:hypothetical protein [Pseudomonas putida]OUM34743.1 hypothetical protein B8W72_09780 [Pseudomonas putida]
MIEAALMGGALPGPWSSWEFVGSASLLASGIVPVAAPMPEGVEAGDLIVALMSPLNEAVGTTMPVAGWQHLSSGGQDYVCAARYTSALAAPRYVRSASNSIFITVLAFRAQGWSTIKLEAHVSPAVPLNVTTSLQNELLLCIGVTPKTTRGWEVHMSGAEPVDRVQRNNAPAMQVYSANVDFPHQVSGISVDALSGSERNLILTVS